MQSVIQYINSEMLNLKKLLNNLMECSDIVRWNYSKIIVPGAGDYQWEKLNDNGRKIQEQLRNNYIRFMSLIRFLATNNLTGTQQHILNLSAQKVQILIEQNGLLFKMDKEEQFNHAVKALDLLFHLVSALYEVTEDYCIVIPDSGALIANPDFEKWTFEEIDKFKIFLLPLIVNELDKTAANNETKNKILEYAKHGNLLEGVKINEQNLIQFVNVLQIKKTLPWLDLHNEHDRIIAVYFEIVKAYPHSQVVLITNNSSLQEKVLSLNVPYHKVPNQKIDSKPAKSTSVKNKPVDNKKTDVEQVKATPQNRNSQNAMPQIVNNKTENKLKEVIVPPVIHPPIIQNKPTGIKVSVPKPKIKLR